MWKHEKGAGRDPLTVWGKIRVKGLRKFLKKKKTGSAVTQQVFLMDRG